MQDQTMRLCDELIWAEDPTRLYPASENLQKAIHDRLETVRATAQEVAMIDLVVDLDAALRGSSLISGSSRQQSG
jgi:hypothetical protein